MRGELNGVVEWGIQPEDFRTGPARSMYLYLLSYYALPQSRGSVIGPIAAGQVFPNFTVYDDPYMTTEALCSEVRQNRIALESNERMDKIREDMAKDPLMACAKLQQLATEMLQLGSGKATDIMFGSAYDRILHNYQLKKSGVDLSVAHFPWGILQKATGGLQADDYIVFYGRPKSYKSWVLAFLTMSLFMQDKRLLLYTKEMTAENIYMRIIACLSEIPYQGLRTGKLAYGHEVSMYQSRHLVRRLEAEERIIVLSGKDAPAGGDNVPWMTSKIKTYQPDIVSIDGMYLMSDVRKNKDKHARVQSISNDLRQMNLETRVPIVATLQANRQAAKHNEANFDEVAFSDAIGQDATMVARIINERETPTALVVLAGAREFDLNGFRINAVCAENFSQYGYSDEDAKITAKDIDKAKDKDKSDTDKDNGNGHAKPYNQGMLTEKQAGQQVERAIAQEVRGINAIQSAYSAPFSVPHVMR
jgi:DnaB helicase-like protein